MGKASDISGKKAFQIETLLDHSDYSQRKIAGLAGVSQSTVRNIKRKLQENSTLSPKRFGRCGRKRITTSRGDRKIQQITLENRRRSQKVIKELIQESGVKISCMTLRRRWKEMGFSCRRPLKKPKLTSSMKMKRLVFARKYADWTEEDWEKVFWFTFHTIHEKRVF